MMKNRLSVIIPNHNGSRTIGKCLEALLASDRGDMEVIVVDDCSDDGSLDIIRGFPCKVACLDVHSGASKARNEGARISSGEFLFFIDADCVVGTDTLTLAARAAEGRERIFCGGTYALRAYDDTFFSTFQAAFIHYSETKRSEPDYIASHAMLIDRKTFEENGGFPEDFMPIIEDVEFSHRLRRAGTRLEMEPSILVRHIFNFTFLKSLRNAFRKSKYWTFYSLCNRDLLSDSGAASVELKTNVLSAFLSALCLAVFFRSGRISFLMPVPVLIIIDAFVNRRLFAAFHRAGGPVFAFLAALYYMVLYPLPVGLGSLAAMAKYYLSPGREA